MSHSPSVSPAESVQPARVFSRTAGGSAKLVPCYRSGLALAVNVRSIFDNLIASHVMASREGPGDEAQSSSRALRDLPLSPILPVLRPVAAGAIRVLSAEC